MVNEQDVEIPDEQPTHEFQTGFNHAYILAANEPQLLEKIVPDNNPKTEYFEGFFSGKMEHQREQQEKQLKELEQLRTRNEKDHELDR